MSTVGLDLLKIEPRVKKKKSLTATITVTMTPQQHLYTIVLLKAEICDMKNTEKR